MAEVLACVDFSDLTDRVVTEGALLARAFGNRLHLLHVAAGEPELAGYDKEDISSFTRDDRADQLMSERERLTVLAEPLQSEGINVKPLVVMGHTVEQILSEAARLEAGFIVLGSHGRGGLRHMLLGSVTEALIRRSSIPLVVVPRHTDPPPG